MGLRAQVRRLPGDRVRRRRRGLRAVAGGEAAAPLLPRARRSPAGRYVLDGELVILGADGPRGSTRSRTGIHPAESRVKMLAEETPALLRAFDVSRRDGESCSSSRSSSDARALEALDRGLGRRPRLDRADAAGHRRAARPAPWLDRRGRDRQGARRALPARGAQGDGQGQARAHRRLRRGGLAPGQGGGHGRLADPRPLRRAASCASSGTPRASRQRRSGSWSTSWRRTRPASAARRSEPLGGRSRARVGRRCGRSWSSR